MESSLRVARNEPEAEVEFAGVSLKPFSVARSLPRDSSSAFTPTMGAAMQIARTAVTARYFVFILRPPRFLLFEIAIKIGRRSECRRRIAGQAARDTERLQRNAGEFHPRFRFVPRHPQR